MRESTKWGIWVTVFVCFCIGMVGLNYFKFEKSIPEGDFQQTVQMSESEKELMLSSIRLKKNTTNCRTKSIRCFDVNSDGDVALGFGFVKGENIIDVYDNKGLFQYGFSFFVEDYFFVEWEGNDLWIYAENEQAGILLDEKGNCIEAIKIYDSKKDSYWEQLRKTKRVVGEKNYYLEGKIAGDYSKLVMVDSAGEKKIIFDASSEFIADMTLFAIFVGIFALGFIALRQQEKEKKRQ